MSARRDLLPALTPLRFPAALGAAVYHVWGAMGYHGGAHPPYQLWHVCVGLSFFFVLSGFILTYNYLDEFRSPTRRGVWNFLVARWARTYPVHVLAIVLLIGVDYRNLIDGVFGNPYICVATMLGLGQAYLPLTMRKAHAFNSPSWSLSAEWTFYLLLPLLIPALTTGSLRRRVAVVGLLLTPWALAVAGLFGMNVLGPITPLRYPPVRVVDFLVGVLLAMAWHGRSRPAVPQPRSVGRATAFEIGAFLFAAWWMWVIVRKTKPQWLMASGWVGVHIPPFLPLIWVLARGEGWVSRGLASRPLTYLGDISFALYMLHQPVLSNWLMYGQHIGLMEWSMWWRCCGVLAASFVAAVVCYHCYEIPLRDFLRKRLTIRKPKVDTPAATVPLPAPADPPAKAA